MKITYDMQKNWFILGNRMVQAFDWEASRRWHCGRLYGLDDLRSMKIANLESRVPVSSAAKKVTSNANANKKLRRNLR